MVIDKELDAIVKDNQKARRNARTAAKKAKLSKGSKKQNQQRGRTGKARDQAPVRGRGAARGGRPGRGGGRPVGRQADRPARGASGNFRGRGGSRGGRGRPANIPRGGLRSASAIAKSDPGLKVHVDNLDFGVTEKDMRELFQEFGTLKKVQLHYDAKGKSQGNCDIVFAKKGDGIRAMKKYNGVPLDGRKMKIDFVGAPVVKPAPKPAPKQNLKKKLLQKKGLKKGAVGKANGAAAAGKGPRKGKKLIIKKKGVAGKKPEAKKPLTEEQLDKQLDAYLTKGATAIL